MIQIRILIVLFFVLKTFSSPAFAQLKSISKKEIIVLADQAVKLLNEGNFEKSISTSRLVLNYASAIKDNHLIAVAYNTLAANLHELSEFDKSIYYYKKGLFYANKSDSDTIKNFIYNNLGNLYCFEKKQYETGISYYKKSLEYSLKSKDTAQLLYTKINITWAYFDKGLYKEGQPYLAFINKYNNKFGKLSTIVPFHMLNGMYYSYKGENAKANSNFIDAINYKEDNKSDLSYAHLEYSKFLFKNGNFKEAYKNLAIYDKIKEDLYDGNKLLKANVAGINLELDEYKRDVHEVEFQKKLQAESLRKSQIIVALFIVAFSILLLLLYSLFRSYQYKKKRNKELTQSNKELLVANHKAEEGAKAKNEFISTISHELRTPLYGVIGITNMLVDEHKELALSPHLNSLKFSASYLLSLVNDILHINKIEEKKLVLENFTFNIVEELEMIISSLSFLALNFENKIILNVDSAIPKSLNGDKLRLSQILMNLISNALKFTRNGEVIIDLRLLKSNTSQHLIEFEIKDNGVGIDTANQHKIFEKFVQVGRNDNDYQGTGLGLAIVKNLLGLFKSEIVVESKIGVGTTFKFAIAFEGDINQINQIVENEELVLNLNQLFKILVVEDNKINQMVTKRILEKNNCICSVVEDGYRAIEILHTESFDVILMDINMPLINGFETTRRIRQNGIYTPIIALTAFGKEEIEEEAVNSGINDIIIKPFDSNNLFKIITQEIESAKKAARNLNQVS